MLLGSNDNENKLFSASGNDNTNNSDDTVGESFMLSMKANDPESVADKLKENTENKLRSASSLDDEFDNFEFDSSISAFKPLSSPVFSSDIKKMEINKPSENENKISEPETPVKEIRTPNLDIEKAKEITEKPSNPLFDDNDPDMLAFAQEDANKPFNIGKDLDFAGSTGSTSTFSNPEGIKDDAPLYQDDLEFDESLSDINPFKPAKSPFKTMEVPSKDDEAAVNNDVKAEVPSVEAPKAPSNLQTYGNVKSGVNAFAKKPAESKAVEAKPEEPKATPTSNVAKVSMPETNNTPAEEEKPVPSPFKKVEETPAPSPFKKVEEAPAPSPFKKAEETVAPSPFKKAEVVPEEKPVPTPFKKADEKPAEKTPSSEPEKTQPKAESTPNAQNQEKPKPAATRPAPAPIKRPSAAAQAQAKTAETPVNSAFAPKGRTNATSQANKPAPSQPKQSQTAIQPVTQVKRKKKTEKARKEPGKFNILILAIVFVVIIGICFLAESLGKKGDKDRTVNTTASARQTLATNDETTTTAVETSEATEATTTTAEATTAEETTVEETTETSEETTTAETTRRVTVEPTFSYSLVNPHTSADGCTFEIAITNTGSEDIDIADALSNFNVTVNCGTEITNISSDFFNFSTTSGTTTFDGSIRSHVIPAGQTVNASIVVTTSGRVQHFTVSYSFS